MEKIVETHAVRTVTIRHVIDLTEYVTSVVKMVIMEKCVREVIIDTDTVTLNIY